MSETETTLLDVAARLRAEFDESFARPLEARAGASIDLIAVHVAGKSSPSGLATLPAFIPTSRSRLAPAPLPSFVALPGCGRS
jgi:hypothetical protein